MGLGTILLIVLILILVGVLPTWPHARSWVVRAQWNCGFPTGNRNRRVSDGALVIPPGDGEDTM
jgi:hypothetical protein